MSFTALALALTLAPAPFQEGGGADVEPAELGTTANVHRCGDLWFSGQFAPDDVAALRSSGIRRVITLRGEGELDWDEEGALEAAGVAFVAVPFRAPDTLTDEVFDRVRALLGESADGATLLHCGSANRAGGAWIPYRVLDQGVPLEVALAEAEAIGLSTAGYRERAIDYVTRRRAEEPPKARSVAEGINAPYKDPDLDVDEWVARFEVESREVYAARDAVMAAVGVPPGRVVADVGAGTGLYTFLLADAVGADGWVFAVDIVPRFLEHVRARAGAGGVGNVTTVLCAEDSIGLPPASVDLVWVCDTYHHFEYPAASLASIRSALRPGGRLLVLDFERTPGVTREWLLDHVRAGKDVVRGEIEAAGFAFAREHAVEGLEENYLLEFTRPAE